MNFCLEKYAHKKHSLLLFALCMSFILTGCGSTNTNGTQARSDLTAEHVRGLYSGMKRNEIEDLLGGSDKSLAEKESIEVYSLADGTTAVLRFREDTLMSAYLRDKDNKETPIFGQDNSMLPGVNGINETDVPNENSTNDNSIMDNSINNTLTETQDIFETSETSEILETNESSMPMESK